MKIKHYRSSIPKSAQERVVSSHKSNGMKHRVDYIVDGKLVGFRQFNEEGEIEFERPLRDGLTHGTVYMFHGDINRSGEITFSEPHKNGLAHGTARQWSEHDGSLIGTYSMKHGTGLDLWRNWSYVTKAEYLSEARYIKSGKWHGFEWWINEDQALNKENHFQEDLQHGILREWNASGKLRRGYPKYWVANVQVSKRKYLAACVKDASLPLFQEADNQPQRIFPPEVLAAIQQPLPA